MAITVTISAPAEFWEKVDLAVEKAGMMQSRSAYVREAVLRQIKYDLEPETAVSSPQVSEVSHGR